MANDWVDFKLIRERVGIVDILTHYNLLDTVPAGEQFKIHCPFHKNDIRPSCNIHTGMQAFHCFGCHAHGGVLMFVRLKEGITTGNDLEDDRAAGRLCRNGSVLHRRENGRSGNGRIQNKPRQRRSLPHVEHHVREEHTR